MYRIRHFLSPLSIYFLLLFVELQQAQPIAQNFTCIGNEVNSSALERMQNQIEILKSGNDILKLRLEMMIGKLGHYFTGIDGKLQNIDDKLQMVLKTQLEVPSPDTTSTENSKTSNTSVPDKIVGEVTLGNNAGDGLNTDSSLEEKLYMSNINGEESLKVCTSRADKSLVCSDIQLPTSCANSTPDACWNNKCYIQNRMYGPKPFWVSCNDTIAGGGWTVIQRRINGTVDFLRNWADYKKGFGDLDGEFWIGLDKLHALTNELAPVELYVQLIDFNNVVKYAKYDSFSIGDEASKYVLESLGSYSGDAGNSLGPHENKKFTTKDQDNDNYWGNCVDIREGAWWYDNCAYSNLNGRYFKEGIKPKNGDRNGITWYRFHSPDYSMKSAQMMIRPKRF